MPEPLMTIKEVAEWLRVGERTVRRWVAEEGLPYYRFKKLLRFRASEVEGWTRRRHYDKRQSVEDTQAPGSE